MRTPHKNLSVAVYEAITTNSRVDCRVMTIQDLDCMFLTIYLLVNRGMYPNATLISTMDQDSDLHFKRVMQHMVATKANTDDMELINLPKNTQPNTTEFKNWCTTIEEELDQKTLEYIISPLVYVICESNAHIYYGYMDQNNTML